MSNFGLTEVMQAYVPQDNLKYFFQTFGNDKAQ